jgi:hypothetical protein
MKYAGQLFLGKYIDEHISKMMTNYYDLMTIEGVEDDDDSMVNNLSSIMDKMMERIVQKLDISISQWEEQTGQDFLTYFQMFILGEGEVTVAFSPEERKELLELLEKQTTQEDVHQKLLAKLSK